MPLEQKTALVIGAGRGVGRAVALALAAKGARTIAVARTKSDLDAIQATDPRIETTIADATAQGTARDLIASHDPDLVAIVGGIRPKMGRLSEFDWDSFSAPWQSDTKMTFLMVQAALQAPLRPGSAVLTFASGAALNGSPLSGGYAGAKRTQHFIGNSAQVEADSRGLDLTFTTLYPKQLIAGTDIASDAATAYGRAKGGDAAMFMNQWEIPLTPEAIAGHVVGLADLPQRGAFALDGSGISALG